jgi:hypothetical protein
MSIKENNSKDFNNQDNYNELKNEYVDKLIDVLNHAKESGDFNDLISIKIDEKLEKMFSNSKNDTPTNDPRKFIASLKNDGPDKVLELVKDLIERSKNGESISIFIRAYENMNPEECCCEDCENPDPEDEGCCCDCECDDECDFDETMDPFEKMLLSVLISQDCNQREMTRILNKIQKHLKKISKGCGELAEAEISECTPFECIITQKAFDDAMAKFTDRITGSVEERLIRERDIINKNIKDLLLELGVIKEGKKNGSKKASDN